MKILLDTNIIIHREANRVHKPEIGTLFKWIDNLQYSKYIHPVTIEELNRYKDAEAKATMGIKIENYNQLKYIAPFNDRISRVSQEYDKDLNDQNDTKILNEIFENRIDILISEDKKIHKKAEVLNISGRVYTIQRFLEKVTDENPDLVNYDILAVKQVDFGQINLANPFFDSFKEDYSEFEQWFNKKSENPCYICNSDNVLSAFLYIKVEDKGKEGYADIIPVFQPKRRLKIGTLKVTGNGYKIGERFLKIVFDNAIRYKVDEIYVTVFDKRPEQIQLIEMLEEWGFVYYGIKTSINGQEKVYVKPFSPNNNINIEKPRLSYPFFSRNTDKYIIKIEHQYHTELFPDSINTKEDKTIYQENAPHRNRIGKVYISHSPQRNLKTGDIFLVYRIGETSPKVHSSTITSICIVENIKTDFIDFEDFFNSCNRRTLIKKEELLNDWWNKFPNYKPFIINFLYAFSFPTPKPTLKNLIDIGVLENPSSLGKGFYKIDDEQFKKIVNFAYRIK